MRAGFWHVSRMKRLPIDKYLITALVERFPAIAPPIPPPTDAGDHYGRRFNNVELKLWKRQLAVYRVNREPYRDA
ncbi:hypothetical protein K1719_037332 [Acacia pycnantha]|nr:hypothetical protein K1719_037332 [Acacia pycnantha]